MPKLLDADEVVAQLATLTDWSGTTEAVTRVVTLDAADVTSFMADLQRIAREMDHDPELHRSGNNLTITMSTHSAGGVTELDIAYARRVDELVERIASSDHE